MSDLRDELTPADRMQAEDRLLHTPLEYAPLGSEATMSKQLFTTNEPHAEEIHELLEIGMLTRVEIDYEALAIWLADEDDMAGLIVASMDEYRRLARSHALRLGLEGGDDEVPGV